MSPITISIHPFFAVQLPMFYFLLSLFSASFPLTPAVWTLSVSSTDLIKTKVRGFHYSTVSGKIMLQPPYRIKSLDIHHISVLKRTACDVLPVVISCFLIYHFLKRCQWDCERKDKSSCVSVIAACQAICLFMRKWNTKQFIEKNKS